MCTSKYAWRRLQLIHPVIYVSLVWDVTEANDWKIITDRLKVFAEHHKYIECLSMPRKSQSDDDSDNACQVYTGTNK